MVCDRCNYWLAALDGGRRRWRNAYGMWRLDFHESIKSYLARKTGYMYESERYSYRAMRIKEAGLPMSGHHYFRRGYGQIILDRTMAKINSVLGAD